MQKVHDIFEVKLSWKGIKKLEETKQKLHDFLVSQGWLFNSIGDFFEKNNKVIELQPKLSSSSVFQFQIGNENYPIKEFEKIKELLLQMIQCKDIEYLEIQDINLKESEEEFKNFLHEQSLTYDKGEWHTLK